MKIETITAPNGSKISFCPERGGIITALALKGASGVKDLLFMDWHTFDQNGSVRGGVPIMFPNAGPIPSGIRPGNLGKLKRHGFARDSSRWSFEKNGTRFIQRLTADEGTWYLYPYKFWLSVEGLLESDGSCSITQRADNLEGYREMPISMGLHPYFKVRNDAKREIEFRFDGGKILNDHFNDWSNGKTIAIDNPSKVAGCRVPLDIFLPEIGWLAINISPEYRRIWLWSQPNSDYICIEPVMGDAGSIVAEPILVSPKSWQSASINIRIKD